MLMPDFTSISVSILAFTVSIVSLMLFLAENKRSKENIQKKAEEALSKAQSQSNQILSDATRKAQTMLGQAEAEEIKLVQGGKQLSQQFEQAAEQQFKETTSSSQQEFQKELQAFGTQIQQSQSEYLNYLSHLKTQMDQAHEDSLQLVKEQVNGLFEKFEQNLSDFLTQTEQKTIYSIDLELRATRELINTYKQQQLKIIDENAVAILERTLTLVLSKKLTLSDQVDLVNEALEKAKVEKFIV